MKLGNYDVLTYSQGNPATVIFKDATIAQVAALDCPLEIYAGKKLEASFIDHHIISVAEVNGHTHAKLAYTLAPDTAATLQRMQANMDAQQTATTDQQTQIDENAEAIVELAALIAGEE